MRASTATRAKRRPKTTTTQDDNEHPRPPVATADFLLFSANLSSLPDMPGLLAGQVNDFFPAECQLGSARLGGKIWIILGSSLATFCALQASGIRQTVVGGDQTGHSRRTQTHSRCVQGDLLRQIGSFHVQPMFSAAKSSWRLVVWSGALGICLKFNETIKS